MQDHEIPKYKPADLEGSLSTCFGMANFELDENTKKAMSEVAEKYNNQTGALALNAMSAMAYAMQKDRETLSKIIDKLKTYDFPNPSLSKEAREGTKYMLPGLRASIVRTQEGMTKEDMDFFTGIYDELGVKPQS